MIDKVPLRRINLAGLGSAAIAILGLLSHPEILGLFPEKYAIVISAIGIALQSITRGVQQGNTQLVDKEQGVLVNSAGRLSREMSVVIADDQPVSMKETE